MWDPYSDFQKTVLPNGLEVFVMHWQNRPWVKVGCIIHAGAFHDLVGSGGSAHFAEHLVSGNASASYEEMENFFKFLGGDVDFGSTSTFDTTFEFTVPAIPSYVRQGLLYFADMLLEVKIKRRFEEERNIIKQEWLDNYNADFFYDAHLQQLRTVYQGTPFEHFETILGSHWSIQNMEEETVQKFLQKWYVPSNMSLVIVSGMPYNQIVDLIAKTPFAQDCAYFRTCLPYPLHNVNPLRQNYAVVHMSDCGMMGIDRCLYRAMAKLPYVCHSLGFAILNEMLSDMIFDEMRERQSMTYSFQPTYEYLHHFVEVSFTGWVRVDSEREVSRIVRKIISDIPGKRKLFENVRRGCINQLKMHDADGSKVLRNAINDVHEIRGIVSLQECIMGYESVTFDQILSLAEYLSPEYLYECIHLP